MGRKIPWYFISWLGKKVHAEAYPPGGQHPGLLFFILGSRTLYIKTMKYFCLLAGLFLSGLLPAQEAALKGDGDFFTLGVGIPINTVRDRAHSPLAYRGSGFRIFTTYENIRPEGVFRLNFSMDNVSLKAYVRPRQDVKREAGMNDLNLSLAYYTRIGNAENAADRQYFGGVYYLQVNQREYPLPANNISGFLLHTSLGVGALDQRSLETDQWTLNSTVDLPLVSAIFRPAYIGLPDVLSVQKVKFGTIVRNFHLVTVNQFFKINVGFDFDKTRQTWRTDRYSYNWNLLYTPLPTNKSLLSTTASFNYGYRILR